MKGIWVVVFLALGMAAPAWAIEPVGSVASLYGKVTLERNGKTYGVSSGLKLYNGDSIVAGEDAYAKLMLTDESLLTVGENSTFKIENLRADATSRLGQFRLMFGKVRAIVSKFAAGKTDYRFVTPTAVAGVRGTHLVVEFDLSTKQTTVSVLEGSVGFKALDNTGGGPEVLIGTQMRSEQKSGSPAGQPVKMSTAQMQQLDSEISKQAPKGDETPATKSPQDKGAAPKDEKKDEPSSDQEGKIDEKLDRAEQAAGNKPPASQQENPAVNPATQTGVRVRW